MSNAEVMVTVQSIVRLDRANPSNAVAAECAPRGGALSEGKRLFAKRTDSRCRATCCRSRSAAANHRPNVAVFHWKISSVSRFRARHSSSKRKVTSLERQELGRNVISSSPP
jgi:hypothetical protein